MPDPARLGDLQLAILRLLWSRGEATAAEVHADLHAERGLAPTTIATMLRRLASQGFASFRNEGRVFVYRAAVDEESVRRAAVRDLHERLFAGEAEALVHQLLDARELSAQELERIRALIDARAQDLEGPSSAKSRRTRRD
jgi:predicted transcriptional regulator